MAQHAWSLFVLLGMRLRSVTATGLVILEWGELGRLGMRAFRVEGAASGCKECAPFFIMEVTNLIAGSWVRYVFNLL
jgi:hypothetical protein